MSTDRRLRRRTTAVATALCVSLVGVAGLASKAQASSADIGVKWAYFTTPRTDAISDCTIAVDETFDADSSGVAIQPWGIRGGVSVQCATRHASIVATVVEWFTPSGQSSPVGPFRLNSLSLQNSAGFGTDGQGNPAILQTVNPHLCGKGTWQTGAYVVVDGFTKNVFGDPHFVPTRCSAAHDLTGDLTNDIIGRTSNGQLSIYAGDGLGTFTSVIYLGAGWGTLNALMITSDFNGDGYNDLIGRESSDGSLWLYPGNGRGQFTPTSRSRIGTGWGSFTALLAPGDFNGDGTADVIGRRSDGTLWLYAGTGTGSFASTYLKIGTGWTGFTALLAPGDFNGDGTSDLIARKADGSLWLYPGNGTGKFLSSYPNIGSGWNYFDTLVAPGDINGDGKVDVLGRGAADGSLWLYAGSGTGGFSSHNNLWTTGWSVFNIIA